MRPAGVALSSTDAAAAAAVEPPPDDLPVVVDSNVDPLTHSLEALKKRVDEEIRVFLVSDVFPGIFFCCK